MGQTIELLAPAGDLSKLDAVYKAGADAAYIGGIDFSLRANTLGIPKEDFKYAVKFAHNLDKKIFFTLNIVAHNHHLDDMIETANYVKECGFDAIIISDSGLVHKLVELGYNLPIHVSTQANTSNLFSVEHYSNLNIERVNLARELTIPEISEIAQKVPKIELEVFIHGAMCIAYSGRCLISRYYTDRSGNLGGCSHSCRYNYKEVEIREEKSGRDITLVEGKGGTEILASEDLNTLPILDKIINSGVHSLKIEGRTKSTSYLTTVVSIYRKAIDNILNGVEPYYRKQDMEELEKLSPRGNFEGFFEGKANEKYLRKKKKGQVVVGQVRYATSNKKKCMVDIKMPFTLKDKLSAYNPHKDNGEVTVLEMKDIDDNIVAQANPNDLLWISFKQKMAKGTIIRKETSWKEN